MEDVAKEKIEFQYIMDYRSYRKGMILARAAIMAVVAGALVATCVVSVMLAVILPVMVVFVGIISILYSIGNEQTYTVYNTRVVLKRRGDYGRKSIPLENIVGVKCKTMFYEKSQKTTTVIVRAKNENGKVKKYKMKHIFNAVPVVEFLTECAERNNNVK